LSARWPVEDHFRDALLVCVWTGYSAELSPRDAQIPGASIFQCDIPSQWQTVQQEEQQDEELRHISNQILELTKPIHAMSTRQPDGSANQPCNKVTEPPTIAAANRAAVRSRRGTQRATSKREAEKNHIARRVRHS
jgi:hypothetical protein